ncbi:MAG: trypsin-like peptidase domain-containing protein [Cyanobacteria bacterium J06626_6]
MNRYYTVKNRLFGKKGKIIGGKVAESNIPMGMVEPSSTSSLLPIMGEPLSRIVNKAFSSKAKALKERRAHGAPDFLPFSFLSKGLRCGAPVCLILRKYTESSIGELIENIESGDYTASQVSGLLKIDNAQEFWGNNEFVSTALKEVDGLRERLSKHIVDGEPVAVGTGFLVGQRHILTNNHVLPDTNHIEEYIIRFRFEVDFQGRELDPIDYRLDPTFFYTNEEDLDYTLIGLSPLSKAAQTQQKLPFPEAGNNFGWLQMLRAENGAVAIPYIPTLETSKFFKHMAKQAEALSGNLKPNPVVPGEFDLAPIANENQWARDLRKDKVFLKNLDPAVREWLNQRGIAGQTVSLIQHPKGAHKEVVLSGNRVQAIYQNWIQYQTDAEPGSSGSPLFNDQWQLVGIHHSALLESQEEKGLDFSDLFKPKKQPPQTVKVIGYLGTRICRVAQDLSTQQKKTQDQQLKAFLIDYVDYPKRGRVFISAGRKRDLSKDLDENLKAELEKKAAFEAEALFKLGSKIVEQIRMQHSSIEAFHVQAEASAEHSGSSQAEDSTYTVINWLQTQEKYRPGDVALEILLDTAEVASETAAKPTSRTYYQEQSEQALEPTETRGAKVYYQWSQSERKFDAELLLKEFWKCAQQVDKAVNGEQSEFPNLGVQPDIAMGRIKFCSEVSMPSLVLHAGYLTNEQDCNLFKTGENLDNLSEGIAHGLIEWTNTLSPNIS